MQSRKCPRLSPSERYLFELLIAVELLLSFTLFGYIHLPPISIATAFFPIFIAGCLLTPLESTFLGFVFGLASMFKASAGYVQDFDKLFSPFQSGFPLQSILLSVGTRTLFGLLVGLAFAAARRSRRPQFWFCVISAAGPYFHGVLVYAALGLLFAHNINSVSTLSISDLLLAVLCTALVIAAHRIWNSRRVQTFCAGINFASKGALQNKQLTRIISGFSLFVMLLTILSAVYFAQRLLYMMGQYGITVSSGVASDTLHLQIQFLFAVLALNLISVLVMQIIYKYMSYQKYLGELDALTNALGRRMFLTHCERLENGWLLFLDADCFKTINDTLGHAAGDTVLKGIASSLRSCFSDCGTVGRMGGDEFAVLILDPIPEDVLTQKLDRFLADISGILGEDMPVSCSIGVCRVEQPQPTEALLKRADQLLYAVKRSGKGHYLIRTFSDEPLSL